MTLAICFGGLALCGFAMVLLYGHELRRMARFLRNRDGRSNSRLTTEMPGPGFADLARAVNGTLDAADQRERERAAEQRQFQRDLASLSHDIRTPLMGAKGYVSLAAEEPDDACRAHYLQAAEARLTDMEGLLDALFAYARATDAAAELDMLKAEVIKALRGESTFSKDLLGSMVSEAEAKCTELQKQFEDAQAAYEEGQTVLSSLEAQYDDIISWADMYDSASLEAKKMIVNCLIRRVEVYRGYKLHIDFNIDFTQFSLGLDIVEIAA